MKKIMWNEKSKVKKISRFIKMLVSNSLYLLGSAAVWFGEVFQALGVWLRDQSWSLYDSGRERAMCVVDYDERYPINEVGAEVELPHKIKRGGCEVQTGFFKRVDCSKEE
jgi:hypothetical protein